MKPDSPSTVKAFREACVATIRVPGNDAIDCGEAGIENGEPGTEVSEPSPLILKPVIKGLPGPPAKTNWGLRGTSNDAVGVGVAVGEGVGVGVVPGEGVGVAAGVPVKVLRGEITHPTMTATSRAAVRVPARKRGGLDPIDCTHRVMPRAQGVVG